MREDFLFKGIISPVVTLFDEGGEVDWEANEQLADRLIAGGVHGILLMGSTGEFSSLTMDERQLFAEKMTAYIGGRTKVIVGTGCTSLKDTLELSKHAERIKADGVLIVNPFYWKFTEDQLYSYYTAVADEISLPILLYNIPQITGQNLSPELVGRLSASCENIVGIKDTIVDFGHIRKIISSVKNEGRPEFAVFAAFDEHLLPALELGAAGSINATSVFAPEISVALFEAFTSGNYEKALQQHRKIAELMSIYEYSDPLFLAIKEAVQLRILHRETGYRSPAAPVDGLKQKVEDLFEKIGMQKED